jgi:hypothetical protein
VIAQSQEQELQAQPEPQIEEIIEEEVTSNYVLFDGVISEIEEQKNGRILHVEKSTDHNKMIFPIADDVLTLSNSTGETVLKEEVATGTRVDYYNRNKPMPMIYPATMNPEIVIIQEEEMGSAKVSQFDEDFFSLDHELKLNLTDETILVNEKGESITKEELAEKELIVF